jgi:DNA-binding NarL/FixJ family response regulator
MDDSTIGLRQTRVLVCDGSPTVHVGIRAILESDPAVAVAWQCGSAEAAIAAAAADAPDVVVMDAHLADMDGFHAASLITATDPDLPVLMYTTFTEAPVPFCGASGFLSKDTPRQDLVEAIRSLRCGGVYVDPWLVPQLVARPSLAPIGCLGGRHLSVLDLLGAGVAALRIAQRLDMSPEQVDDVVREAQARLGCDPRTRAIARAVEHALVLQHAA